MAQVVHFGSARVNVSPGRLPIVNRRFVSSLLSLAMAAVFAAPARAQTPSNDGWKFDFVPLYFWATSLTGELGAGPATVPIDLDFEQAADNLGGAFSFHLEATRGRWGILADLNFIKLETVADFTVAGHPVAGDLELANAIFEAGISYLASEPAQVAIIGGLRTYTLSPKIAFATAVGGATPVDASITSPNAFVGVMMRPRLSTRWTLLTRADIGGGDANVTWSAEAGLGVRLKTWLGLAFGYKGLGIDVEFDDKAVRTYDVVHHGPFVGMDFHWGSR
jgi:hypothetical protein